MLKINITGKIVYNIFLLYKCVYYYQGMLWSITRAYHVISYREQRLESNEMNKSTLKSMVSWQKGPTRHAYAWQIGPFWQDTLEITHVA